MDPIPQWTPIDPSITQLGLRVRALRRPTGRGLVALIPVSDDENQTRAAIRSLQAQDAPPDLIVVDGEPDEALDIVLRELADEDAILVMDSCCLLARLSCQLPSNASATGSEGSEASTAGPLPAASAGS